ncbi:MAG TPA: alpha/beta hydrolase, partial [Kribbella sp.]|nr:alpha/beta hydrolase [Kribbella sp.]
MAEDRSVLTRSAAPPDDVLRYGEQPDQVMDVWSGTSDRPIVVLVHGGFWRPDYDRVHLRPMAEALSAAGWPVASIEYRREPGHPDVTVDDLRAALDRLPVLLGEARPMVLVGHSAGGHLVLWAATAVKPPGLRGTVALAPVADLALAYRLQLDDGAVADFLGTPPEVRKDLDPVLLPQPTTPVTVVHGTADTVVPVALAESYTGVHRSTRYVPITGAGHFELIDPTSTVWSLVADELSR